MKTSLSLEEEYSDAFDRCLGEQVRDQILREYRVNERRHVLEEEYSTDVTHQDGDLPYRMQITYEDGGASYHVNDYFPHLHFQAAAVLADQDYDSLVDWGSRYESLDDFGNESAAIDRLIDEGAVEELSSPFVFS